jgi:hypothetical protein
MFTVIASSITCPGSISIWTFDTREAVGLFITLKGYKVDHLSIYESGVNSYEPAKLSLQSIEDFYTETRNAILEPARRCLQGQLNNSVV